MKYYAPYRCEQSIEVIMKMGVRPGEEGLLVARLGVCGSVGGGVNAKNGGGWGVRGDVNQELNLL